MSNNTRCDPYIWDNVSYAGKAFSAVLQNNTNNYCKSNLVNTIIVWYIFAVIVGIVVGYFYVSPMYSSILIVLGITILLAPVFLQMVSVNGRVEEEKVEKEVKENFQVAEVVVPTKTYPTARNPFMNVLIDEIKYNPMRPPAANIGDMEVKTTLDDFFRVEFTSDPTDVFGRSQSQRQFITMPSTTVPNDASSYQNWLYKIPGKTCKEGGRDACLPGTDGGQLPWLNVER